MAMRVLLFYILIFCTAAELHEKLRYFETLHHVDVKVRKKRNVQGHEAETKDVSFSAFGKDFNLVLKPGSPVIGSDFTVKLINGEGQSVPFNVNENDFFTGHLSEDETIKADALTENGLWTASIYTKDEIYSLEPSWRHLPASENYSMIVYRYSDVKWDNIFPELNKTTSKRHKLCAGIRAEDSPEWDGKLELKQEKDDSARPKRATSEQNTCNILAVADYTFYMGPGGGFPHRTANYIILSMQKINKLYRETVWDGESALSGMGMQIRELRIHSEITASSNYHRNGRHYNMFDDKTSWLDHDFLKQFGEDQDVGRFCLAHLFTHRGFAQGVLGLAYIASPRKYAVGGICSSPRDNDRAYNTGFSSSRNTMGNNLLTLEAMIVTAHEFGHNWGAEHDAETAECAPNSSSLGKYIMFPYAVSGYDENNIRFSPCSKRYISAVLATRSASCFTEEKSADSSAANVPLCGNGNIDKGEDCDGGGMGINGLDPCCSRDCKFVGNATCSSTNFECCKNCQTAPNNTLCRGASKELCLEAAMCTGFSLECPSSASKDNMSCIDDGRCISGVCLDYCAYEGQLVKKSLKPCRCEDVDSACLRCCRSSDEPCRPQNGSGSNNFLQDGRPCNFGYCEAGMCQKTSANMIQRLFAFIEQLDSSTFVAFMKSNIVGTIIVFSLVVWIPLSWTVSCIDKRKERKSREMDLRWVSNDALLIQSLQSNILASHLKNYTVKDSKLYQRGGLQQLENTSREKQQLLSPSHDPEKSKEEKKYNFYGQTDGPVEMETVI